MRVITAVISLIVWMSRSGDLLQTPWQVMKLYTTVIICSSDTLPYTNTGGMKNIQLVSSIQQVHSTVSSEGSLLPPMYIQR